MTRVEIELPASVHEKARAVAERDSISVAQLIAKMVSDGMRTLEQLDYLKARAQRSNRARFRAILAKVPDVPPMPGDELPPGFKLPVKGKVKRGRNGK